MNAAFTTRSERKCYGGLQGFYEHPSESCAGLMRFSVYLPPLSAHGGEKVPAVYCLAGLECTEETFMVKAGAQRLASELGLALVTCDTSPRSARFPGDDESWDFGQGAGFYLDATEAPWSSAYRMKTYVTQELRALVQNHFPIRADRRGVMGHSMGGHGALTFALGCPSEFQSASAFAPIVAPSQVPWGQKAFSRYLGDDRAEWAKHDAVELVKQQVFAGTLLVDQGLSDTYLDRQLRPELFRQACAEAGQRLELRLHDGYDHGYYFVQTFVGDHLRHHAKALRGD